jgi:pimeloyl-ACP methyl ester carboxylesterase
MQKVVDGQLVNYEVVGNGKQNLVIMHGWGGSLHNWLSVARELKDRYKIVLFDFPGLGGSAHPKSNWDIYKYAEFTNNFISSLGIKRAVFLGHSFGGRVAILLGSKYSQLVEKLILVDAAGMEIKSIKAKIFGSVFALPISIVKPFMPEALRKVFRSKDYQAAGKMRDIFMNVVNQNLRSELKHIVSPTLIIWGEKDHVLSLKEAKMIKHNIANSHIRIVWGATHWPHDEKFTKFMSVLEEERI